METKENKRMLALACTVADLKTENMYLAQRVQEIAAEYSNSVCQSGVQEKRKDKDQLKQMIFDMRKQYDKLERENIELAQRMQQLVDENNEMARQLNDEEAPSKQTLEELEQMRDHCDKLEKENRELERFSKAMNEFVIDKNLYMKKNNECPYHSGDIPVCSTYCLECGSCLGVLEGHGVICGLRLKEANVSLPEIG